MDTTPVSLLERMRQPGDENAWARFIELATPMLNSWARHIGLRGQDADELTQEVLVVLVEKLPEFSYDREKSFRGWMRTVALNKFRQWRRRGKMASLDAGHIAAADIAAEDASRAFWEHEYHDHLVARAMQIMQADFEPATWRASYEHIVSGRPAAEIAAELGMTAGAVYAAKIRVLKRLREELEGMMD